MRYVRCYIAFCWGFFPITLIRLIFTAGEVDTASDSGLHETYAITVEIRPQMLFAEMATNAKQQERLKVFRISALLLSAC